MTAPYMRRPDPVGYSRGWEVPVLYLFAAVAGLGLAALIGVGLASAWFGGGWVWPHGTSEVGSVIGGLFRGDPARGFGQPRAALVASRGRVYGCVVVCELLMIAIGGWAGVLIGRYRRPGDQRSGMATRHEADQVLGKGQLRAVRSIIRPDLYGKESR
jgi:hypothetical protein